MNDIKDTEQIVYQGQYMTVTEEVIGSNTYERAHLRDGVHIIPVKGNKILLIREYRVHENAERWKLIGGWMDKDGKDPLVVAQEELAEEVGMEARKWSQWKIHNTHGFTLGFKTFFFIAEDVADLSLPPDNPDADEVREARWVDQEEFQDMLDTGVAAWDFDAIHILQFFKK